MKPLHYFLIALFFLAACSEDSTPEEINFEYDNIPLKEKIKKALEFDYLANFGIKGDRAEFLQEFYKSSGYKAYWANDSSLTDIGTRMKTVLEKSEQLGVPEGRHKRIKTYNFLHDELVNTLMIAEIAPDLKKGVIDFEAKKKRSKSRMSSNDLSELIEFDEDQDLRHQFLKFGPKDTAYWVLAKGLARLIDDYPMDPTTFKVPSIKKDTLEALRLAEKALISKGYLEKAGDTSEMMVALKEFQVQNGLKPDGVIGKYTSKALNESMVNKRDRIILAMDKIRAHEPFPERYIHINIPEYKLRFYINDSLKSDHNIVVGTYQNQTPELTSKLRKIVAYPYWNVPYSISSNEILPAVKYNSGYLDKHNYKIYRKGELVDPSTVNWKEIHQSSFPFKVVQDPGRSNSLGIIKFDFANAHSVYFHDTPSKALFGADVRAYSHGCMRTQHPVDLARAIIERDEKRKKYIDIALDSLDSIMDRGSNREIKLKQQIPIYIEYVTVVRKGDEMITHIDIYGRDEEYLEILRE